MLIWVAPLFLFGLVVFVHELGHFIAAKAFGVYAPRFSIGFGPAIARWRRGETEYRIGILPLGGYVRMASQMDEAAASLEGGSEDGDVHDSDPNAMKPFGPLPVPAHRWFESKPLAARLVIMVSGVLMNLLLGFVLNVGLAKTSGGDVSLRVSTLIANKPAANAGIQIGDSLVSIDGTAIPAWSGFISTVSASAGRPLHFGLVRGGKPIEVTVVPAAEPGTDSLGKPAMVGRIGLGPVFRSPSWPRAVQFGAQATGRMATLVYTSLQKLATRETSVSELSGPIGIAQQSVQAARSGLLLFFTALISVNLALMNLLPLPILDGGQIVLLIIESVRGKPLSDRARENVAKVGLALILLLFITVTFNDVKRLLVGWLGGHAG